MAKREREEEFEVSEVAPLQPLSRGGWNRSCAHVSTAKVCAHKINNVAINGYSIYA